LTDSAALPGLTVLVVPQCPSADSNLSPNQKKTAETGFIIANNVLAKAMLNPVGSSDADSDTTIDDPWQEVD